jgi:hypothetical protein
MHSITRRGEGGVRSEWGGGGRAAPLHKLIYQPGKNSMTMHINIKVKGFGDNLPLFLFVFTLIEKTYNILYILLVEHHSCCPHCFPLGIRPPLGCRAEIRTRACRTASWRATI